MQLTNIIGTALLSVSSLAFAQSATEKPSSKTWNFDSDVAGKPPAGFSFGRTGKGAEGQWIVRAESDAPSKPNVLAQLSTDDTDYRFPVAFTGPEMKDLRLSVKCKPISGKVDQGCGLVFRLKDADNYYVVRANALEDNVRLYHVVKGSRRQFAGWNGKVASASGMTSPWRPRAITSRSSSTDRRSSTRTTRRSPTRASSGSGPRPIR